MAWPVESAQNRPERPLGLDGGRFGCAQSWPIWVMRDRAAGPQARPGGTIRVVPIPPVLARMLRQLPPARPGPLSPASHQPGARLGQIKCGVADKSALSH
jgi:hypothetical protein